MEGSQLYNGNTFTRKPNLHDVQHLLDLIRGISGVKEGTLLDVSPP